jgi:3-phenylpropionate/trans-cinnamate dioxygenase alpha subunit
VRGGLGKHEELRLNYHGWAYGLDGSLVNVPLEREAYYDKIDKSRWGMKRGRR